uniref:Fibronectin type-III domain-containing protein n=1 Tax=Neolamprologus brichardi TaxID=32507 RepID=A0A3Q4GCG3_NEOBR
IDERFDDVASVGTVCSTTVSEEGSSFINESSSWNLSEVVKFKPPLNVQVENAAGFYNITWSHDDDAAAAACLRYRVRIRTSENLLKDPVLSKERVSEMHILINHNELQPQTNYTVDVQATYCPEYFLQGPWSEWSSTANWKTEALNVKGSLNVQSSINIEGGSLFESVLCVYVLHVKLQVITYIPRPDEFFKPLYHNYEGNFKVRRQNDVTRCVLCVISKSSQQVLPQGDFLHIWTLFCGTFPRLHTKGLRDVNESVCRGFKNLFRYQYEILWSSLRSYQDGASLGSFEEDNREHASYDLEEPHMSRMDRQSGVLPQHENRISNDLLVENLNFQPHDQFDEPERVSLDSFEQSEDGYPHVDLDTIDSGFGECGSPGASDSNTADQINSDLFHQHTNSNSNYVKQWMIM